MRKGLDFGNQSTNCFDFEEALAFVCSPVVHDDKGRKGLVASPVYMMDPCQLGVSPLKTQTLFPTNTVASGLPDGAAAAAVFQVRYASQTGNALFLSDLMLAGITQTSALNAANTVTLDLRGLNQTLDIIMTASAGTATVTISASIDNVTFFQLDSLVAAATTVKHYNNTTVGASTYAISPLSWRYVKVVAGTAGVGNTTTLTMSMK